MKKLILPLIFIIIIGVFIFAKMLSNNLKKETEEEKNLLKKKKIYCIN